MKNETGYRPGHPWYYKLGGVVHKPKQILAAVKASGYRGYKLDEIEKADSKYEPDRSATLRKIRESALMELKADLECYREVVRGLRAFRNVSDKDQEAQPICSDIHMSMSLKYNHLYNDFAHLVYIDDLLSQQPDLFD